MSTSQGNDLSVAGKVQIPNVNQQPQAPSRTSEINMMATKDPVKTPKAKPKKKATTKKEKIQEVVIDSFLEEMEDECNMSLNF